MNENKQKTNKGVITLVIILIILVIGLIGYIVYDKTLNKNEVKTEVKEKIKQSEKALVYDATYKNKVTKEYYKDSWGRYVYASDIRLPYIDIDSDSVKKINEEIKKLYNRLINEYIKASESNDSMDSNKSNYTYSINNNILSVLIEVNYTSTDMVPPDYYAYNIDLNTKEKLSYTELLKNTNNSYNIEFNNENITKIMTYIINYKTEEFLKNAGYDILDLKLDGMSLDDIKSYNLKQYTDSVSDDSIIYFLDYKGQLNIPLKMSDGVGMASGNIHMLTIEEDYINSAMAQ